MRGRMELTHSPAGVPIPFTCGVPFTRPHITEQRRISLARRCAVPGRGESPRPASRERVDPERLRSSLIPARGHLKDHCRGRGRSQGGALVAEDLHGEAAGGHPVGERGEAGAELCALAGSPPESSRSTPATRRRHPVPTVRRPGPGKRRPCTGPLPPTRAPRRHCGPASLSTTRRCTSRRHGHEQSSSRLRRSAAPVSKPRTGPATSHRRRTAQARVRAAADFADKGARPTQRSVGSADRRGLTPFGGGTYARTAKSSSTSVPA